MSISAMRLLAAAMRAARSPAWPSSRAASRSQLLKLRRTLLEELPVGLEFAGDERLLAPDRLALRLNY